MKGAIHVGIGLAAAWIPLALCLAADPAGSPPPAGPANPPASMPSSLGISRRTPSYADRGGYWLMPGSNTTVKLRVGNHGAGTLTSLWMRIESADDWVRVQPASLRPPPGGPTNVFLLPPVPAGGAPIEIPLVFAVLPTTHAVTNPTGLAVAPRRRAQVSFVAWSGDSSPGSATPGAPDPSGQLPVPSWKCWVTRHVVRAATPELALPPPPIEWHIVDALPDETRTVDVKIGNLNSNQTLHNVVAIPSWDRPVVEVGEARAQGAMALGGLPGVNAIKPGATGSFKVDVKLLETARPGEAATVRLDVRSSTPGTTPHPWEPHLLVWSRWPEYRLPGNFEAYLFYNLPPPASGSTGLASAAASPAAAPGGRDGWLPVPKGTKIGVTQVYTLPTPDGAGKTVEQYIGFGNVLDDKGYIRCSVDPVGQHDLRFRLVAETMANVMDVTWDRSGPEPVLTGFKARHCRAAVTPFGNRSFRSVSHVFRAEYQERSSKDPKKAARQAYSPLGSASNPFTKGLDVLLPYFGYEKDVNPAARKGILIDWEGELSTGGLINFPAPEATGLFDTIGQGTARFAGWATGVDFDVSYQEALGAGGTPGLIYHNRNELLHILAAMIRAQDFLSSVPFFREPAGSGSAVAGAPPAAAAAPVAPAPPAVSNAPPPDLPGVIALWRVMDVVPGGETGYALQPNGTFRLAVQSRVEDPDERDTGLILRGYGAAVRQRYFKRPEPPPSRDEQAKPRYNYYERIAPAEAWRQGFDLFLAACALNSPAILNTVTGPDNPEAAARRSVDLADALRRAAAPAVPGRPDDEARKYRGADNPVAVAAGLWCAARSLSAERVMDFLVRNQGADLGRFLEYCVSKNPDLLHDMVALGLCPRILRTPSAAAAHTGVPPRKAAIVLHPNGVLARGELKATVFFASSSGPSAPSVREIRLSGDQPATIPFGEIRDQAAGKQDLLAQGSLRGPLGWTVRIDYGGGVSFSWPVQTIPFEVPAATLKNGAAVAAGPNATLASPPAPGAVGLVKRDVKSLFDGKTVLGRAVYQVEYTAEPDGSGPPADSPVPMDLTLAWDRDQDPGPSTPGIYWLNPATERWDLVSEERAGERRVRARIVKSGAYALMLDREPPSFENVLAGPTPFMTSVSGRVWRLEGRLTEGAALGFAVKDAQGRPVRVVLQGKETPPGDFTVAWDGRDAQGRVAADGLYLYELTARDRSGLDAKPLTGSIRVFNGLVGSASGTVNFSKAATAPVEVRAAGLSVRTAGDAAGAYWLGGLPPGSHLLAYSSAGFFDEMQNVLIAKEGDDVAVPAVRLTHLAVENLAVSPEVFTPDGDGTNDYAAVRFANVRTCPYEVGVFTPAGEPVRTLQDRKALMPGRPAYSWNGEDDEGQPMPSGWYVVRVTAFNRDDALPQGERRVLLDRGLVQDANAFPYLFSPNGDGFEDVLQVGFFMEGEGRVKLRILQPGGAVVAEAVTNATLREGWCQLPWDGRGADGRVVPDGLYRFELAPEYLSGHASKIVSGEFAVDSRPPEIGEVSPANGAVVESTMPTVTARILSDPSDIDPDQLKFKIDEQTVNADRIDLKERVFSFTPKTSIGIGPHIAIAYAQDWAGNYAAPQAVSFTVQPGPPGREVVDRAPPEILELEPAKGATVYTPTPLLRAKVRDLESGIDPNHIAIEINGVRVPNAVKRFIPGKSGKPWDWYGYEKALVLYEPLEGEIRYVPLEPLPAGRTVVSLQVSDKAGNASAKRETIFDIVVDAAPPAVAIRSPRAGQPLATTAVTLVADLKDAGPSGLAADTLRVTVDGEEVPCPPRALKVDGASGALVFPLPEPMARNARHAVSVTIRDRAGNLSPAEPRLFSIVEDPDAPRIDLLQPASAARFPRQTPVVVAAAVFDVGRSGLDEASVSLLVDGRPVPRFDPTAASTDGFILGGGQLTYEIRGLSPGRHELEIRCRDRAGNEARPVLFAFEVR